MKDSRQVRVRIAPSPTGDPHVGTAYIALFNYVFARKHGGRFVLRIEDTDQTRSRASSERMIQESLRWLGLDWDEGPDKGGEFGPYRQSERLAIYQQYGAQLVRDGAAYPCFCTPERLAGVREQQKKDGKTTGYDRHCRELDPAVAAQRVAAGEKHVLRLKMPTEGIIGFDDLLRGRVEIEAGRSDDQVLLKSDGFPTYHFASVVDDHLMEISHVVRAEEWISSTPKHVKLYEAFGWEQPVWVHLPLLRNKDKSKISKRKNPVSLTYYRRAGILPQAMVNFLGLMGWSFGGDREIFTPQEMQDVFDFKNISLGGPVFDQVKLTWLNQHYLHQMNEEQFVGYLREEVFSEDYLRRLRPLIQERLARFDQFVDNNAFFFNGALNYDGLPVLPKKVEKKAVRRMVKDLADRFDAIDCWDKDAIESVMNAHKDELGWKPRDYFMTVRFIVTGRKDSPPLGESMAAVGKDMVAFRLRNFLEWPELKG